MTRGEAPITKNIRVIDAQGNEYEATYAKRAKGLAKAGRARFIDEYTLCLACPPNINLGDKNMNILDEVKGNGPRPDEKVNMVQTHAASAEGILARIDAIIQDTAHIKEALDALRNAAQGEVANAMGDIIKAREATNQQTLRLLEKMYDDAKPIDSKKLVGNLDLNYMIEMMESEDVAKFLSTIVGM